jgi:hypothetical protein
VDYNKLSKKGKSELLRFSQKSREGVCISKMVRNAPSEEVLMKMMQWIETGVMPK